MHRLPELFMAGIRAIGSGTLELELAGALSKELSPKPALAPAVVSFLLHSALPLAVSVIES